MASTMMPAKVKIALIAVTWFGVIRSWNASAANNRPSGRFTTSE